MQYIPINVYSTFQYKIHSNKYEHGSRLVVFVCGCFSYMLQGYFTSAGTTLRIKVSQKNMSKLTHNHKYTNDS